MVTARGACSYRTPPDRYLALAPTLKWRKVINVPVPLKSNTAVPALRSAERITNTLTREAKKKKKEQEGLPRVNFSAIGVPSSCTSSVNLLGATTLDGVSEQKSEGNLTHHIVYRFNDVGRRGQCADHLAHGLLRVALHCITV